ncbi:MAG: MBOAT family protein [Polyangiaceae bacterium]|nr:MBOAT family protein [Polyangiaceae bacterium]
MIFTSYTYLLFLGGAFLLYWSIPRAWRNAFLVGMSYAFYCSWRWQYGVLLLGVTAFTYLYGAFLAKRAEPRRWLMLGVAIELTPLLFFKYLPFFVENLNGVGGLVGLPVSLRLPEIILPLGISFFTFQGIAYLVDLASGAEPIRKPLDFVLYKALWPQLIAGPIIRPDEIREQLEADRAIDYADVAEGAKRIVNGFFKKAVLADTLAPYVDGVFAAQAAPGFVDTIAGMVGFGLQIYFDFSGYSDIAIGSARLFGFRFPENFALPYASRSFQQFWGRWHMSLSRWIRDYVFTPMLFASRHRPRLAALWLVTAMAACGFWHGARWTFIVWGIIHGLLLVLNQSLLRGFFARAERAGRASFVGIAAWVLVMFAVAVAWLFFRAQSLDQAAAMLSALVHFRGGFAPMVLRENGLLVIAAIFLALLGYQVLTAPALVVKRWAARAPRLLQPLTGAYYCLVVMATIVLESNTKAFVYFQF